VLEPPLNADKAAKKVCDLLWNAFGFESCPMFDSEGSPMR